LSCEIIGGNKRWESGKVEHGRFWQALGCQLSTSGFITNVLPFAEEKDSQ